MLAALLGSGVVTAGPSGAQEEPAAETDQVRDRQALVAVDVDVMQAEGDTITAALDDLEDQVQAEKQLLTSAEWTYAAAQSDLAAAEAAVAETQTRLDEITLQADAIVIDSFVNPPSDSALDALTAESLEDATVKQSLLDMQTDANADLLGEYEALLDQLEIEKAAKEEATELAEAAKEEADALENVDPVLAEQIRAREAEIAEALNMLDEEVQAERAQATAAELAAQVDAVDSIIVPGGVVGVPCPDGGVVEVAGDIAGQVERLLGDAADAGYTICGYGYRNPADQIAVRRANCGTSTYAIYSMPASSCSPPTAKPGTSMHERGLAIDFTSGGRTIGSTSGAYRWLKANAANYGLYNLPGEPWHWSVDGN